MSLETLLPNPGALNFEIKFEIKREKETLLLNERNPKANQSKLEIPQLLTEIQVHAGPD